jgi:hypothetical protein
MKPLLEFVERTGRIRLIHHSVRTKSAFLDVVRRWPQKQYAGYSLGYFSFHGTEGCLLLGRERVGLDELGEELRGACQGKTIYFGSCSTLGALRRDVQDFRRITRAKCVAGYTEYVDWFESAAFELLLLDAMSRSSRSDAVERWLRTEHRTLVRRLGFKMYYGRRRSARRVSGPA